MSLSQRLKYPVAIEIFCEKSLLDSQNSYIQAKILILTDLTTEMAKQNFIFFSEQPQRAYETPVKITNSFFNRFAIDEEDACEILAIKTVSDIDSIESLQVINCSMQKALEYENKIDNIHLVCAFRDLFLEKHAPRGEWKERVWKWMEMFAIQPSIITFLTMERYCFVSQESMMRTILERNGKLYLEKDQYNWGIVVTNSGTMNDDIDAFVTKVKVGDIHDEEEVGTVHFREVNDKETKLWELGKEEFLESFRLEPGGVGINIKFPTTPWKCSQFLYENPFELKYMAFSCYRITFKTNFYNNNQPNFIKPLFKPCTKFCNQFCSKLCTILCEKNKYNVRGQKSLDDINIRINPLE